MRETRRLPCVSSLIARNDGVLILGTDAGEWARGSRQRQSSSGQIGKRGATLVLMQTIRSSVQLDTSPGSQPTAKSIAEDSIVLWFFLSSPAMGTIGCSSRCTFSGTTAIRVPHTSSTQNLRETCSTGDSTHFQVCALVRIDLCLLFGVQQTSWMSA